MSTSTKSLARGFRLSQMIAVIIALVAAVMIAQSYLGGVAEPVAWRTAGLVLLAIGLFATHAIPEFQTGLLVLFLAIAMKVAPNDVIFAGFTVGGLWLLFSGIIIGQAVAEAGLGNYIARRVLGRIDLTFERAVVLIVLVAVLLGFVVPATIPRIIILMPIAIGLAEAMGYHEDGPEYAGFAVAVVAGSFFPTLMVMTANLPTIVHVSAIDALYGSAPAFSSWVIYFLPLSIFRALALIAILLVLFRSKATVHRSVVPEEPMTPQQKRIAVILAGTILLWLTDVWHGIAPAWIALLTAIIVLWRPLDLLPPGAMKERIDLSPVLYVAGVLCIGGILHHNGLDARLGSAAVEFMGLAPGATYLNYFLVIVLALLMTLAITAPAVPIVLVPLARQISETSGFDITTVVLTQFVGLSTILFPYQAPPLVVALSLSRIKVGDLVKVCVLLGVATLVLGAPLNYFWWRLIGVLGAS